MKLSSIFEAESCVPENNACGVNCAAVRENRTRGGRNKFGPLYRRDRALRRMINGKHANSRRGGSLNVTNAQYFNSTQIDRHRDEIVIHEEEVDMKPDINELALRVFSRDSYHDESSYPVSSQSQSRICEVSSGMTDRWSRDGVLTSSRSQRPSFPMNSERVQHSLASTVPCGGGWTTGLNCERSRPVVRCTTSYLVSAGGKAAAGTPLSGFNNSCNPGDSHYVQMSNASVAIPVSEKKDYQTSGLDVSAARHNLPVFQ